MSRERRGSAGATSMSTITSVSLARRTQSRLSNRRQRRGHRHHDGHWPARRAMQVCLGLISAMALRVRRGAGILITSGRVRPVVDRDRMSRWHRREHATWDVLPASQRCASDSRVARGRRTENCGYFDAGSPFKPAGGRPTRRERRRFIEERSDGALGHIGVSHGRMT